MAFEQIHIGPGGPRPGGPGGPGGHGGPGMHRGGIEEPPAKKQKTEENLIPESEFMANNPSPVTFKVNNLLLHLPYNPV